MKKALKIGAMLLFGLPSVAFAKSGIGSDALQFVLALAGFLLLLAGLLKGTDYLMKNGKGLLIRVGAFLRKQINALREHLHPMDQAGPPVLPDHGTTTP
jgi:hypothetical protein